MIRNQYMYTKPSNLARLPHVSSKHLCPKKHPATGTNYPSLNSNNESDIICTIHVYKCTIGI